MGAASETYVENRVLSIPPKLFFLLKGCIDSAKPRADILVDLSD